MHCVFCFVFVNVMKGEAWAWKFKNESLFILSFFRPFFEVLPIAQQIIRDSMGIGFFEKLGKESRTNEKRNLWHGQSYNPDSRD